MSRHVDAPLISVAQAAERLGIGLTAAYEWAHRGDLPGCIKLNNRYRVRRAILEAFANGSDTLGHVVPRDDAAETHGRRAARSLTDGGTIGVTYDQ